ncbi:MAG: glutamate--tRNA ligase [Dehalococcoidia bacterium]|nr:glutamate--tRNA ligase [Dehalococcoidia bacterium]
MVRLRYAPSPTGDPHLGNIRTAIWSWLYAKKMNGQFIIRIEDTDQARTIDGATDRILNSLSFLGIDWDEGPTTSGKYGPYIQSKRKETYVKYAEELVQSDLAYYAFETPSELAAIREEQKKQGLPPGYDGRGRLINKTQAKEFLDKKIPYVIRFKMPQEGETSFTDLIRGKITVQNKTLDDLIILKSDGFPTYHFAHIIDDHLMEITHVTRGDEWIPSTPKHVAIIAALGWELPIYVHTPIILGPDGGKLSKRHGARSVLDYKEDGYLPQAVMNYLAMTGWALDDKTNIISIDELKKHFDLHQLLPNPATFDEDKLNWLNGIYMREMPLDELANILQKQLTKDLNEDISLETLKKIVPIIQERINKINEITNIAGFFFKKDFQFTDLEILHKNILENNVEKTITVLLSIIEKFEKIDEKKLITANVEQLLRSNAEANNIKPGKLFMLLRIIVTGQKVSPPLFETIEIVGKNKVIQRLQTAIQKLS